MARLAQGMWVPRGELGTDTPAFMLVVPRPLHAPTGDMLSTFPGQLRCLSEMLSQAEPPPTLEHGRWERHFHPQKGTWWAQGAPRLPEAPASVHGKRPCKYSRPAPQPCTRSRAGLRMGTWHFC